MGIPSGLREVRLTDAECRTLRAATVILGKLRALRAQPESDEDEQNIDIALAAYTCQALAAEGKVDAWETA